MKILENCLLIASKFKNRVYKFYEYWLVKRSHLFDKVYYLEVYPDVKKSSKNPIWHYLAYGAKECRNPHLIFDTEYYLRNNLDVKKSGMNPLVHFIKFGDFEARRPHPLFDNVFYREFFGEKLKSGENTLCHYIENPDDYKLRPHPLFDTEYYLKNASVMNASSKTPLEDFLYNAEREWQKFNEILDDNKESFEESTFIHNKIALAPYVKHILRNDKLRLSLIRHLKERDYEGFDYLYRSTKPILESFAPDKALNKKENRYVKSDSIKNIVKVESLYEYALKNKLIVYENTSENWSMYSPSLKKKINLNLPREYICRIENTTFIAGTRLILQKNRLLHDEMATYDHSGKEYGVKLWNYTKAINSNEVEIMNTQTHKRAIIKKGILISCDHDNNYFHWMVESMSKMALIKDFGKYVGFPILVSKELHRNLIDALKFFVGDDYPIFELDEGTIYKIDELIVPSDLSRILDKYHGEYDAEIDVALSKKWVHVVKEDFRMKAGNKPLRKLYLTRKTGTYRKLMNEEQIELELLKKGFEIIDLSSCSIEFQRVLFSQTNLVIAPTGATITNMLLAPPDCKFIIMTSNHEGVHFNLWEQLAAVSDVQVVNCKGTRLFNRDDFHDDYEIDLDRLMTFI